MLRLGCISTSSLVFITVNAERFSLRGSFVINSFTSFRLIDIEKVIHSSYEALIHLIWFVIQLLPYPTICCTKFCDNRLYRGLGFYAGQPRWADSRRYQSQIRDLCSCIVWLIVEEIADLHL